MARYYVHTRSDEEGDYEVHREGCNWMPRDENRMYLGEFPSCQPAVAKAKLTYPDADGCYYCSRECHTS